MTSARAARPAEELLLDHDSEWSTEATLAGPHRRSLSLGFFAMLPLFAAYELGLATEAELGRNTSELLLFRAASLLPFGERGVRLALLTLAAVAAAAVCFRRRLALGPALMRIVLEGILAAILLGPALALAMRLLPASVGELAVEPAPPAAAPAMADAAIVFGGAAYEELLFRVGLLSLAFLGGLWILRFFGAAERPAHLAAQAFALSASSLAFAGFHLRAFTAWLGTGGEAFSAATFAWRALAGLSLALLFLWRGPGVAAWTHGLFNFALLLGAGPEILL